MDNDRRRVGARHLANRAWRASLENLKAILREIRHRASLRVADHAIDVDAIPGVIPCRRSRVRKHEHGGTTDRECQSLSHRLQYTARCSLWSAATYRRPLILDARALAARPNPRSVGSRMTSC